MGCCTLSRIKLEEANITLDETSIMKEKIEKVFRFNPLHKFGSRRQTSLLKEFCDYQIKYKQKNLLIQFFCENTENNKNAEASPSQKVFDKTEKKMLKFTFDILEKSLKNFVNYELFFLHVVLFVLSNTKNNLDHKQDVIFEIINDVFFLNKDERTIDVEKLKIYIKSLINISLITFLNFIVLNVLKSKKEIDNLIDCDKDVVLIDNKYDKYKITDYIFEKIKIEINRPHSFAELVSTWEDYLLGPIIFAGYSNEKNISNYNLKLKAEIIQRLADIFDSDKIIRSIVKMDLELIIEQSDE